MTISSAGTMNRLLVVLAAAALLSCSDSRCSKANCHTMIGTCHLAPAEDPTPLAVRACQFQFDGGFYDADQFCSDSCNAAGDGALIQCLVDHPRCGDTLDGGQAAALEACAPATATVDTGCHTSCGVALRMCEQACPARASFDACLHCAADCSQTFSSCDKKCSH